MFPISLDALCAMLPSSRPNFFIDDRFSKYWDISPLKGRVRIQEWEALLSPTKSYFGTYGLSLPLLLLRSI
jgi:hypothetical protein